MIKRISVLSLLVLCSVFLSGCQFSDLILLDPKGPIGLEQKELIIFSFLIMMIVVIPVFVMAVWFPYHYRASNEDAEYRPDWSHSNKIEFWVWLVPCLIIIILGWITYKTCHSLDPRKPIDDRTASMQIQVVALDWKWLFIYPEDNIATVNEVAMPVGRSVEFLITSDTVMNSFFIPQLGSQIYAMGGMENRLHLQADEPGEYIGMSANYSGFGYSGMKFKAKAMDEAGLEAWKRSVAAKGELLDKTRYQTLARKSKDNPVEYFKLESPLLFNSIIEKYTGKQGQQEKEIQVSGND